MPRFFKQTLILLLLGFIYLSSPLVLQAQYDPPSPLPSGDPPPGSCDTIGCGSWCNCGSFWCDIADPPHWTYLCCTPTCAAGGATQCEQRPQCDNPGFCSTADDCFVDDDPFHRCGDVSGGLDCLILPHCDNGECWFECRCTGGEGEPPLNGSENPSFNCESPDSCDWPVCPVRITDDTGQDASCDITFKDFVFTVSDSNGIADIGSIYFGLWPGADLDGTDPYPTFPDSPGPDNNGVSPTKYPGCGAIGGDIYEDEAHLIDDYTSGWSDTNRPGFFGIRLVPNDNGDGALFSVANNSATAPGVCPWSGYSSSGDMSNITGTATVKDLNGQTYIEPAPEDPNNTIRVHLRIEFADVPVQNTGFAYHGNWNNFMMVHDEGGIFQYGNPAQWEETDCGLVCIALNPICADLASPPDGSEIGINQALLQWNDTSCWRTDCAGDTTDDEYNVYFQAGTKDGLVAPGNLKCTRTRDDIEGEIEGELGQRACQIDPGELTHSETYYWTAVPNNGLGDCTNPPVWSFTVASRPWWQVSGGDVHAEGQVGTSIPNSCSGACLPYLMVNDALSSQHGVLSYGIDYDLGSEVPFDPPCTTSPCHIAEGDNDWNANSSYGGIQYDYDWWVDHLAEETQADWGGGDLAGQSGIKNLTGGNISGNVGNNQLVLLRSGNVNITGDITVTSPGFLMVVASGTITVSDNDVSSVQGIFIGQTIDAGDEIGDEAALEVQGSWIGWGSIDLDGRDFEGVLNNDTPVMTFIFRPDFIINAPDYVKRSYIRSWQQVPG